MVRIIVALLILTSLIWLPLAVAQTTPTLDDRVAALETRVSVLEGTQGPPATLTPTGTPQPATATLTATPGVATATATPEPTVTVTPVPTATVAPSATPASTLTPTPSPVPPTSTVTVAAGWHAPTTHEHGDAPPMWVLASANQPFSQTRESHVGYKGAVDRSPGGVDSYFIGHILATEAARSHGDHDYQLWLRDPETGAVSYFEGELDFASNPADPTSPITESVIDDPGLRPVAQSVGDAGCETWYNRAGRNVVDIGWTICGRYQAFDGTVRGGVGTFRTIDWIIPCNRLPAGSPLLDNCRVEFGVNRLSFLVNSREHGAPGIVPVN